MAFVAFCGSGIQKNCSIVFKFVQIVQIVQKFKKLCSGSDDEIRQHMETARKTAEYYAYGMARPNAWEQGMPIPTKTTGKNDKSGQRRWRHPGDGPTAFLKRRKLVGVKFAYRKLMMAKNYEKRFFCRNINSEGAKLHVAIHASIQTIRCSASAPRIHHGSEHAPQWNGTINCWGIR